MKNTLTLKITAHFKRRRYVYFPLSFIILSFLFTTTYGVTCWPSFDGDRTVEQSCDYPVGYKVYGDISVNDKVVNITSWTLWIDLSANKITFTTGKMLFTSAKANNSVSSRYTVSYWYSTWNPGFILNCPTGTTVMYPDNSRKMNGGEKYYGVAQSGWMYCGK